MAGTLNKSMLIGYLGRDPDIRSASDGKHLALLSVATSERWTDRQSGEKRERTEWHRVVIFNEPTVAFAQKYVRKGSKVYVEGQLSTRKWQDKNGHDRYTTEVVIGGFGGRLSLIDKVEAEAERTSEPAANAHRSHPDDDIPL